MRRGMSSRNVPKAVSARKRWLRRILYWAAAAAFTAGALAMAVIWFAAYSSANQYDQSPTCFSGACSVSDITEKTATVVNTDRSYGKYPRFWIDLSGLAAEPKHVMLARGGGVWPHLRIGDTVTVTLWRGMITSVRDDKASSQAWDNPDFAALNDYIALLLLALPALALIVRPAVNRSKRMRGTGWFFATWVVLAGYLYGLCLVTIVRRLNFFLLPVSFAVVGLIMYTIVRVVRSRQLRKQAVADARPARVP